MKYRFSLRLDDVLKNIYSIDTKRYSQTRNFLDGDVTKLSPYITRGLITLPHVRDLVLKNNSKQDSYKFIQELAWREYFQKVWVAKGDEIFDDLRFTQESKMYKGVSDAIMNGSTGITILDKTIKALQENGYMHNHARMTIASIVTHLAKCHWWEGSRWMYYHLLDGDLASNMLSWQWVAGTSKSKPYTTSQSLINYWSGSQQKDTFLDFERDNMLEQTIPEILQDISMPGLPVELPESDDLQVDPGKQTLIYHPWHMDPNWKKEVEANRILVIEPSHFQEFPVSSKVFEFIIGLARENISGIQVYVGELDNMLSEHQLQNPITRSYPAIRHWEITQEPRPELFPEVQGYYKSFFAFWKECEKYM